MTTALSSSNRKISILIIIAALCIHGGIGSLLFILEPTYHTLDAEKARVILFNERTLNERVLNEKKQELNKQELAKPSTTLVPTPHEEWGEMLGRKNNFGLPNGGISIDEAAKMSKNVTQESYSATDQQEPSEKFFDTPVSPALKNYDKRSVSATDSSKPLAKNLLNNIEKAHTRDDLQAGPALIDKNSLPPTDSTELVQDLPPTNPITAPVKNMPSLAHLLPEQQPKQAHNQHSLNANSFPKTAREDQNAQAFNTPSKQTPSGLTLASIGRGFIEQSKYDGTHNVTLLGKKGGALSAEQLKIERYVERLAWCLQNSFKLLRNTIDLQLPPECDAQVYLQLNRSGAIQTLELTRSSGNTALDNHTLAVFKNAGSSFPPVPSYINVSPFSISFHIDYGIAEQSMPLSFSLRH